MEKGNMICAVIDSQGFFVNKVYYPREISIVNDELKLCFEISHEFTLLFEYQYSKEISFQSNRIHGLPLNQLLDEETRRVFPISKLRELIEGIYFRVCSEEKPYFAIKNNYISKLLQEWDIPFVNLEIERIGKEICPPYKVFETFNPRNYCVLHATLNRKSISGDYRCSLNKSVSIWGWLKQKIQSENINQIFGESESALPEKGINTD